MHKSVACVFILLLFLCSTTVFSQNTAISGTVTDVSGEALIGVNVSVKGTANGAITDIDGKYSLQQVRAQAVIVFSYVGYLTQEITVGSQRVINVQMKGDTKMLEDVVVVAYGTQKARSVTGAMSKLNTDELVDMPVSNIGQKLQGKFSGVQIYQANGEPNAGLTFRIRGQASPNGGNSPLVVIDGFPSTTGLESLSPDEIENITILKDAASAALYGSRAANGVILVTTKAAKAGKTHIELSTNFGWENVGKRGRPDVMNAQEFAKFKKEYYEDAAIYEGYTGGVPEVYQHPESLQDGTDWFDVLLRTAQTQNYNLSLVSGTEKIKSSVNVNYNKTEGVILNTYSERFTARANNRFDATENITFGLNISASYRTGQITPGIGNGRNILGSSFLMDPQLIYKNDDGTYPIAYTQPGMFANPNFYIVLQERKTPETWATIRNNAYTEIKLIDGLKYRLSGNMEIFNRTYREWVPSNANGAMFSAPPNPPTGRYDTRKHLNWLVENTLNYDKTFAEKHHIDALLGYTTQKASNETSSISATNYPDDEVAWFNAASSRVGSGDKSDWSMISYLARLNYDYDGKYLLSATFRRDGCSRFGSTNKWANFPSLSLGWIASDETFLSEIDKLSYLKFRGSYGKLGNYEIGNYEWIPEVTTANYVINNSITAGRTPNRIGNNALTWETTEQYDLGLDLGLFNDRIFLIYDYYWKKTNGFLYNIDIPTQAGFSTIRSNIGEFHFWGHEFGLETKNLVGELKWNTNFNITFNRNEAVKLGTNNTPIGGNANQGDYNRTEVGQPLGQFYGYIYDGVFMTQAEYEAGPKHASSMVGTVRMKDLNGDGIIDMSDRTFIGDPNPDFLYGITNEFTYKQFDASIVIAGAVGGDIIDDQLEWTENIDGVFNITKEIAERWRSESNPGKGNIPRTRAGTTELFRYNNTRWVSDGSYLMVKNLTIGYTFPFKPNPYVSSLRIYGSAQNLLTLTNYTGLNPEVNNNGSDGLRQGVDQSSYPTAKVFSIGVNFKF
ncbi:MAG: TonB-dependent receptor SusC [Candidatus Ordinivivax streblomastigis]|uniref:TonB-dependent receptor SusC n=1 Tax=Candidatus Ordinivivax streblomastigis TaxID=2540710 RepID=A0A5M8NVR5_9BACT|nr:MAG: TonB-dependent receptor SusC [Candidatus Ordinivivax streblomastigis]